jgi:hypothetical protein
MSALMTFHSIMTCLLSVLALAVSKFACVRYRTLHWELLANMIPKIFKYKYSKKKNNTKNKLDPVSSRNFLAL